MWNRRRATRHSPAQLDPAHACRAQAAPCVWGRGTQRFLYPGNRKVLAFMREWQSEEGAAGDVALRE